jgi:hypothetical protein
MVRSKTTKSRSKTVSKRNYEPHTKGIGKKHKVYRTSSASLQRARKTHKHSMKSNVKAIKR